MLWPLLQAARLASGKSRRLPGLHTRAPRRSPGGLPSGTGRGRGCACWSARPAVWRRSHGQHRRGVCAQAVPLTGRPQALEGAAAWRVCWGGRRGAGLGRWRGPGGGGRGAGGRVAPPGARAARRCPPRASLPPGGGVTKRTRRVVGPQAAAVPCSVLRRAHLSTPPTTCPPSLQYRALTCMMVTSTPSSRPTGWRWQRCGAAAAYGAGRGVVAAQRAGARCAAPVLGGCRTWRRCMGWGRAGMRRCGERGHWPAPC